MKKILKIIGLILIAAILELGAGCVCKKAVEQPKSIYKRLGGQSAVDAAVELFYTKVLADETVKHHFEGINISKLKTRQKQFLTMAFGGPNNYRGRDMRKAHQAMDLTERDFNAIAGHLQATLEELEIDDALIAEVMAVAASTKDDVLNREKPE